MGQARTVSSGSAFSAQAGKFGEESREEKKRRYYKTGGIEGSWRECTRKDVEQLGRCEEGGIDDGDNREKMAAANGEPNVKQVDRDAAAAGLFGGADIVRGVWSGSGEEDGGD